MVKIQVRHQTPDSPSREPVALVPSQPAVSLQHPPPRVQVCFIFINLLLDFRDINFCSNLRDCHFV